MQKIISPIEQFKLEKEKLSKMVKCNTPKMSIHCKTQCMHGKPHEQDTGADSCAKPQFCSLSSAGIRKVHCKKLTQKEIKGIMDESRKRSNN